MGPKVNPRALTGQRSGLVAGSWQANPRETLRGDRSVWCCGGRDEGQGQEGSDCAVVGRLVGRLAGRRVPSASHQNLQVTGTQSVEGNKLG